MLESDGLEVKVESVFLNEGKSLTYSQIDLAYKIFNVQLIRRNIFYINGRKSDLVQ